MVDMPEHSFMSEYFHSFDNEVYPLIFPKACYGMLFEEVPLFLSFKLPFLFHSTPR